MTLYIHEIACFFSTLRLSVPNSAPLRPPCQRLASFTSPQAAQLTSPAPQSFNASQFDSYMSGGHMSALTDLGSDGWRGIAKLKQRGADGVKHMYERFAKMAALNEQVRCPPIAWNLL